MQPKQSQPGAPLLPGFDPSETTPQMRLQMLSTEHWSLLASRNLAWTESYTRAGMFLTTLSFVVVALALVGQASGFGEDFRLFALIVLPIVLLLGIGTVIRMDSANYHDAICVIGMNRIRAGYLELAPDLERYFVMGTTDDERGAALTMAVPPGRSFFANFVAGTPTLAAVLNSVVVAVVVALALIQVGAGTGTAIMVGLPVFVVVIGLHAAAAMRSIQRATRDHHPRFPSRPEPPAAEEAAHRDGR